MALTEHAGNVEYSCPHTRKTMKSNEILVLAPFVPNVVIDHGLPEAMNERVTHAIDTGVWMEWGSIARPGGQQHDVLPHDQGSSTHDIEYLSKIQNALTI